MGGSVHPLLLACRRKTCDNVCHPTSTKKDRLMPQSSLHVTGLTCEYLKNPIGIDAWPPRLSWRLESPERDVRQIAYQILAAADPEQLAADAGALWDSGRVVTD